MRINRSGITRLVFVFRTKVIKIPNFTCQWNHFLKGILANISENTAWKVAVKYHPEQKHLLCPVRWCSWGGWFLVMERAEIFQDWQTFDTHEWQLAGYGGDDKPMNYGILQGKIVKVDYAE